MNGNIDTKLSIKIIFNLICNLMGFHKTHLGIQLYMHTDKIK